MYYNPLTFRMETDSAFHKRGTIVTTPGVIVLGTAGTATTHAVRADRTISTSNGLAGGGNLTSNRTFVLTGMARAVHDNATNGFFTRIASASVASRTFEGTTNQVNVTNGDGVSGNPVFSLPQDIHTLATPSFVQLSMSSAATQLFHAVRADRTLSFTSSSRYVLWSTVTQNLTADRTWSMSISSGSLLGTTNQITVSGSGQLLGENLTLTLPQDIHTDANVQFDSVRVDHAANTINVDTFRQQSI